MLGKAARSAAVRRALPLLVLAALLAFTTWAKPYRNGPPIRSDGVGYHAWTRALLQRDFTFCAWQGAPFIAHTDAARSVCLNKYPPGMALLQLPVMAPLVDLGGAPLVITAAEHEACLIIGAAVLWLTALLLTWSAAMLRVSPGRAACALTFAVFGTGLFHYSTYDSSYTHARSALFCALLLAFAVREQASGRAIPAIVLFASGFFLISLRTTNVLLLGPLAGAYVMAQMTQPHRATVRCALWLAAGVGTAVAIQLFYNNYALGTFSFSSYGDEHFRFDRPMQSAVLFSYERGLFTYYPVFLLGLCLGAIVRRARPWTLLLAIVTAAHTTLYGYWHSWFLGGGMGHRGFVELVPLLAVVLLIVARELRPAAWVPCATAGMALSFVTVQVMVGYWLGTFPFEGASDVTFWKHTRMVESLLAGGTLCRPSRCDLVRAECTSADEPEFTPCYAGVHAGFCTNRGVCAPVVPIKSLASDEAKPYVTAGRSLPHKRSVLAATAANVGHWRATIGERERFGIEPATP
jgi:hypothetical protein